MELDFIARLALYFIPFLFSICFHEYAHGWMAKRLGDNTASLMGRLTMNPVAHADPIGTIILPAAAILLNLPFFGWAKPVPVNERNLKQPKKDMFWIASAGPLSNILLAFIGAFAIGAAQIFVADDSLKLSMLRFLNTFMIINLALAFFNLLPVHPLDGGKVIARFLPDSINEQLEANQHVTSMVLLILLISGGLKYLAFPIFWAHEHILRVVHVLVF